MLMGLLEPVLREKQRKTEVGYAIWIVNAMSK